MPRPSKELQLKRKISALQDYLGPIVNYNSDNYPPPGSKNYWPVRWLLEYLDLLKKDYYKVLKRKKK